MKGSRHLWLQQMSENGPTLPTWARQQVGSYLGTPCRDADILGEQHLIRVGHKD